MKKDTAIYLAFIIVTLLIGMVIGRSTSPDEWYISLAKPPLTPPNYLFGIVWPILYVMIAVAGARNWLWGGNVSMGLWFGQLGLNFLWSPIFFVGHQIALALLVIVSCLALVVLYIKRVWPKDQATAFLMTPYAIWLAFAAYLNAGVLFLN